MRLLMLSPDFPSSLDPVPCIFVQTQAVELQRLGVSVEVHAPVPLVLSWLAKIKSQWKIYAQIPERYAVEGVQVWRPRYLAFPRENLLGWPQHIKARVYRRSSGENYDLIHAHFAHPEGTLGTLLKRRWGKPLVVTLHGDDANTYPFQSPRYMRYFKQVLARADLVLAVSEDIRRKAEALSNRPVITHRVGLHLPPMQPPPDRQVLRYELGLPQEKFVLLFVGAIWQYKGVLELAEALRQLNDDNVLAIFIGEGPLRETLKPTSKTLIQTLGQQPNALVRRYMAAADVLVLPSYREGLPTVVVEAGAAGLPVIASNKGGTPELINEETGYLLKEISPDAILNALAELRNNPQQARAKAHRLRQYVYQYYDAKRNARLLLDLYQELINAQRHRS